jgi:ribosomal protein S18 acetylase RimI-like enzyme
MLGSYVVGREYGLLSPYAADGAARQPALELRDGREGPAVRGRVLPSRAMHIARGGAQPSHAVRPLRRDDEGEVGLITERMRLTLIEVLGHEQGAEMYSMDWLRARVRWHLDPSQCDGEVFVVEVDGAIAGHVIVRTELGEDGGPSGLFSTIYVAPEARRRGIAEALIRRGEAWFEARGITTMATNTSETNARLIALFEKHGYAIALRVPDKRMVHLSKTRASSAPCPRGKD